VGELDDLAAWVKPVDLPVAVADARKGQVRPIRRPDRRDAIGRPAGELLNLAAAWVAGEHLRDAAIAPALERDMCLVARKARVAILDSVVGELAHIHQAGAQVIARVAPDKAAAVLLIGQIAEHNLEVTVAIFHPG